MENKKKCPYCGELIMESARKCRYCHSWLVPEEEVKQPQEEVKPQEEVQRPQYAYEEEPVEMDEVEIDEQTFRDNVPFSLKTLGNLFCYVLAGCIAIAAVSMIGSDSYDEALSYDNFRYSHHIPFHEIFFLLGSLLAPAGCCALIFALREGLMAITEKFNTWLMICIILEAISAFLNFFADTESDAAMTFSLLFILVYAVVFIIVGRKLSAMEEFSLVGRSFVANPIISLGGMILGILIGTDTGFGQFVLVAASVIAPGYLAYATAKTCNPDAVRIFHKNEETDEEE